MPNPTLDWAGCLHNANIQDSLTMECVYHNDTNQMVIVKCVGQDQFYREKVVLPTELFWFEAPENARLEIWQMSVQGQMLQVRADVKEYATHEQPAGETLGAC